MHSMHHHIVNSQSANNSAALQKWVFVNWLKKIYNTYDTFFILTNLQHKFNIFENISSTLKWYHKHVHPVSHSLWILLGKETQVSQNLTSLSRSFTMTIDNFSSQSLKTWLAVFTFASEADENLCFFVQVLKCKKDCNIAEKCLVE